MEPQHDKARRARPLAGLLGAVALLLSALPAWAAERYEYFHTDAVGSVVAVSDEAGQIIERREYEPYGRQLAPTLRDGPGYAGHVADEATGLLHMQQRYYDPAGVFVSVDPVTAHGGDFRHFNRYAYAYNNPYRYNDPDGEAPHIVVKAAGDFALELTFQYLTTGSVDFGQAAIETAKGVVNPMRTIERATQVAKIARGVDRSAARAGKIEKHHVVPQTDGRAADARQHMRNNGIDPVKDHSNLVPIPGDKHDVTKRDSYVRDVNNRIMSQPDASAIRAECCGIAEELRSTPTDELGKRYPRK